MNSSNTITGLALAFGIIGLWCAGLLILLSADLYHISPLLIPAAVLVQTFLYTGLFITAHDAMHGTVAPDFPALNRALGAAAVFLYALFNYSKLISHHAAHHGHPASADDPDYHDGQHPGFVRWYAHFMLGYLSWSQLAGMAIVFNILHHLAGVSIGNLLLFWVAPALLSTLQLFYFGTYLPHRQPAGGYTNSHCATSTDYSTLVSFLTCYHFGYHYEHHEHPSTPWWRLPSVRRRYQHRQTAL